MEETIKNAIVQTMGADFDIRREVEGRYLVDGSQVRIDFMMYPRPHLVDAGFEPAWFGVEAKHIEMEPVGGLLLGSVKKTNQLVWQAITYAQSVFDVGGEDIRPAFVLICANREFTESGIEFATWRVLRPFMQYANVGVLTHHERQGWHISFGSSRYYSQKSGPGNVKNIGQIRYAGNCS